MMPRRKSSTSSSESVGTTRSSIRRKGSQRKLRLKTMSEEEKILTRKVSTRTMTTKQSKWIGAQKKFKDFLSQKAKLRAFREFLKSEFSQENLDFLVEVDNYQQMNEGEERDKTATTIFKRFIKCGASEQVNLSYSARQNVIDGMKEPGAETFDDAQKEIFKLIEQDSYRRFNESSRF